jgi:signal transduction histidine kinase
MLRAVQEALTNVVRHSDTETATVRARVDGGVTIVTVSDAGRGFDPERLPPGRLGLHNSIRQRLGDVGGAIEVVSAVGQGTAVTLRWPA